MDFVDSRSCKIGYCGRRSAVFHQRTGIAVRAYQDGQRGRRPGWYRFPKVEVESAHVVPMKE